MRIDSEIKLDFKDVLIRPKRSTLNSRSEVSLERTFSCINTNDGSGNQITWTGIPIIAANMDTTGTFEMAKELMKKKCLTAIHKHYMLEEWKEFENECIDKENITRYVCLSLGSSQNDLVKAIQIVEAIPAIQMLMLDVANGYSESFLHAVERLHQEFPNKIIIAGNVCTAEMTEALILAGASVVKCGIGGGSACQTRTQSGIGYPQLSAVIECADAAHGLGGLVISDGGAKVPGDLAKAFGAGADFVMLGGMFAAHKESGGELVERDEIDPKTGQSQLKLYKEFYGMSSHKAMKKHHGGMADYRSSEGRETILPYRGSVAYTVQDILGGLRSACTYVGAKSLKELSKRTTFIRVSQQLNTVYAQYTTH